MELREKLLELRKKNGLSQEDLAIELNVSQSTISNYEKGLTFPDVSILERYAMYFDIPITDLLNKDTKIVYNYQNSGGENAYQIIKNSNEELIEQQKETISLLQKQIDMLREQINILQSLLKNI